MIITCLGETRRLSFLSPLETFDPYLTFNSDNTVLLLIIPILLLF